MRGGAAWANPRLRAEPDLESRGTGVIIVSGKDSELLQMDAARYFRPPLTSGHRYGTKAPIFPPGNLFESE